jgi:hypothetical protein
MESADLDVKVSGRCSEKSYSGGGKARRLVGHRYHEEMVVRTMLGLGD